MKKLTYEWTEEDAGQRVDKVLANAWEESRAQIQRWIEDGCITLQDESEPLKAKEKLALGSIVEATPPEIKPMELLPEEMDLHVLYEDESIIVLNKSAGQVVHPGAGHWQGTLVAGLLHHCKGQLSGIGGVERPGIVHRLDADTSGVLVVAKDDKSHRSLADQFKDRDTKKRYLAWVVGTPRPPQGSWNGSIARHPVHRKKMAVQDNGRPSKTDYQTRMTLAGASFIEIRLHTGRTHQIRVHSSHAGVPVVGDAFYGSGQRQELARKCGVERQLLHAWQLALQHPASGEEMEFEAPIPSDFHSFEERLRELR